MRLFKFTAGGSAVIELVEDIGFSDTGYYFDFSNQLTEDVGFGDESAWSDIYDAVEETVGFDELVSTIMDIKVFETEDIGFNDDGQWFDYGKTLDEDVGFTETAVDLEVLSETCEEDVGFGESMQVIAGLYVELTETVGFNEEGNHASLLEQLDETVGFTEESAPDTIVVNVLDSVGFEEVESNILYEGTYYFELEETVGFVDDAYETGTADLGDGDGDTDLDLDGDGFPDSDDSGADVVGFGDVCVVGLSGDQESNDLEFIDYGFIVNTEEKDVVFTWESRTDPETHPAGYGNVNYGDTWYLGDDMVKYSFFANGLHPGLRHTGTSTATPYYFCVPYHEEVTITNVNDPDASATCTLTIAENKLMTSYGDYRWNFWVEVFTRDENDVWSLAEYIWVNNYDEYVWTRTMNFQDFIDSGFGFPEMTSEWMEAWEATLKLSAP